MTSDSLGGVVAGGLGLSIDATDGSGESDALAGRGGMGARGALLGVLGAGGRMLGGGGRMLGASGRMLGGCGRMLGGGGRAEAAGVVEAAGAALGELGPGG